MTKTPIEICDESIRGEKRLQLYVNNKPQGMVVCRDGVVEMIWEVAGPQYWPNAKLLLQGMLELSVWADKWTLKEPDDDEED